MYRKSREAARAAGEIDLWRESRKQNAACAAAIKDAIDRHFDGMHLDDECLTEVLDAFDYERTAWVLAATVAYKDYDGRFSHSSREWAKTILPPELARGEFEGYVCQAHPALLEGYIRMLQKHEPELQEEMEGLIPC